MYWATLYWAWLFWWGVAPAVEWTPDIFVFNWYSLHKSDGSVRVRNSNHDDLWSIKLDTFNAPRVDWGWVLWQYYRSKDISLDISLNADSVALLNALIDDFKKNTRKTEWWLEIYLDSTVRRVKASVVDLKFNRQYFNITFCQEVTITFRTMDPHWQEKNATSSSYLWITADLNEEIENTGNVDVYPNFYFNFSSVVSLWSVSIEMWWYSIGITETINTWDVLIIDWTNRDVTLNWTSIDYTWTFPLLEVWDNPVTFDFGSGTFSCDITVIYYTTYR